MTTATRPPTPSRPSRRAPAPSVAPSPSRDAAGRVDAYADAVHDGAIVAGPLVRLACERHRRMRALEQGPGGHPKGYRFNGDAVAAVFDFFETVLRLPDSDGPDGEPAHFLLLSYQAFVLGSLFGWLQRDGRRLYRDAYMEIGKGSGKTPMAAGIGLYMLVLDGEPAPEILAAASTQDQARILWTDAQRIVRRSPDLSAILDLPAWQIHYPDNMGWFRAVSSEGRGLDGKRPSCGLMDEVHEHPDNVVTGKIRAGAKRRPQPLFVEITNSGYDRTSVCWAHHELSRQILEGLVENDAWFAYVCGLDEGDEPLADSSCWLKANPGLPTLPTTDYVQRQVDLANTAPSEANLILRLNFCVWTQSQVRAFDAAKVTACAVTVEDVELAGAPCFAGFDSGQTDDFSAEARIWPLADGRVVARMRYWLPRAAIERFKHRPYAQWERSGYLEVTEGDVLYYDQVEDAIAEDCRAAGVRELRCDKAFVGQLMQHLQDNWGLPVIDQPQGFALNEAIQRLSADIAAGRLCYGDDPILPWMLDNTVLREGRRKEKRLDKEASKDKIDGVAALVMAYMAMLAAPAVCEAGIDQL